MDQRMDVQGALQVSFHRRVDRHEVGEQTETFERTDCRLQMQHDLGRLNFNMVQTMHERQLREVSGWWRDLRLGEHISMNLTLNIARILQCIWRWCIGDGDRGQ